MPTKIRLNKNTEYKKLSIQTDFFELFKKIEQANENCFIFESLGENSDFSRYSIIGFAPKNIIEARNSKLFFDGEIIETKNPYFALREIMPEHTVTRDYAGGLVGYISYEASEFMEPTLKMQEHPSFGRFMFGVYTDGIIFDKMTNEFTYFFESDDRSEEILKMIKSGTIDEKLHSEFVGDSMSEIEHARIVEGVKKQIVAGNTFQCEVGFKSRYKLRGNTLKIYENLRTTNPSPFMYYLKFGDKKIIGASPELMFSLRDGELCTKPLAGTIKRGGNEIEDRELARTLSNDPKERAEHLMILDLHRNDIGKVAQFGTVRTRNLLSIKKFSKVQHLESEVGGILAQDEDVFSSLAASFPVGTVSGAPKIESMKIIAKNENEPRGPYGGAVGQFGWNGDCTFALAIRSVFISGEDAYIQTSGGIVNDSYPKKEYDEIRRKLSAMKTAIESASK